MNAIQLTLFCRINSFVTFVRWKNFIFLFFLLSSLFLDFSVTAHCLKNDYIHIQSKTFKMKRWRWVIFFQTDETKFHLIVQWNSSRIEYTWWAFLILYVVRWLTSLSTRQWLSMIYYSHCIYVENILFLATDETLIGLYMRLFVLDYSSDLKQSAEKRCHWWHNAVYYIFYYKIQARLIIIKYFNLIRLITFNNYY
jgi:hypothetical protein